MKATVTEIKPPKTGEKNGRKWFIQHFTADGIDLQVGEKLAGLLKVGSQYEIEYTAEKDGQYINNNVTKLELIEEIFPTQAQPKNEAVRVVDDTRNSIEDQVRAKIIAELCACGFFTKEDVEVPKLRYWLQKLSPNIQDVKDSPLVAQAKAAGAKVVK